VRPSRTAMRSVGGGEEELQQKLLQVLSRETSLDSMTYVQFRPGESTVLHVHRQLLHLTVTESGTALCVVGRKPYRLRPRTAILVYPNEVHSFCADEKDPYRSFTVKIRIDGVLPRGLPRFLDVGKGWKRFRGILLRMHERRLNPKGAVESLLERSALLELFAVVLLAARTTGATEPPSSVSPEFEETLTLLQKPPFAFPGLDRLAEMNRMNRRSFTDYFRGVTGVSPRTFQTSARMNHAEGMLARRTASVKETAAKCGYSNSQNFIRAFRRYFNTSPAKTRARG